MASPSPGKTNGPSASTGGSATELGVILPYPEEAIARRSFEPVAAPVHPLIRGIRSVAASITPTLLMVGALLAFLYWRSRAPTPVEEANGRGERE